MPAPRAAIYVGKFLGIVLLMLAAELLLVPLVAFLFHDPLFNRPLLLAALLLLGSVGFASVGTLFSAMLLRSRAREVMLPILLYPITVPVIIAGILGTSALLETPPDEPVARLWIRCLLRRGVRHALAVDVRAAHDGMTQPMRKLFLPLLIVTGAMFAYAPIAIANAPYESTMLLIQKIFYFHVPAWVALTGALTVCGVASAIYLFNGSPVADRFAVAGAELTALFGLFGLVTGTLWARKAWGIWWGWEPRLTLTLMLELIFISYLLVRSLRGSARRSSRPRWAFSARRHSRSSTSRWIGGGPFIRRRASSGRSTARRIRRRWLTCCGSAWSRSYCCSSCCFRKARDARNPARRARPASSRGRGLTMFRRLLIAGLSVILTVALLVAAQAPTGRPPRDRTASSR